MLPVPLLLFFKLVTGPLTLTLTSLMQHFFLAVTTNYENSTASLSAFTVFFLYSITSILGNMLVLSFIFSVRS